MDNSPQGNNKKDEGLVDGVAMMIGFGIEKIRKSQEQGSGQ
jgi:hypothetical protein